MNPPENAIVLCIDEKTQIQALDRTQPELPLRKGNAKRLTTTYKRNGVVNLIASLAVHKGEVIAQTMESNNAENFLAFLKKLASPIVVKNFMLLQTIYLSINMKA
jgi:hypothetical protein